MKDNLEAKAPSVQNGAVQKDHRDDVITVVLTADNHLGYAGVGQQPRKREERQQRLRHAFQQATDFAILQGVDLFIQAGDLFDTTSPDERDRSFVAARLAQLKQAGVRALALGGGHDTPTDAQSVLGETNPAPLLSYARLGALHYFPPVQKLDEQELEAVTLTIRDIRVGICGLGALTGQDGDFLAHLRVPTEVEKADLPILVLHAPIEGLITDSLFLDTRTQVSFSSLEKQSTFKYILAGYHHNYSRTTIGQAEIIVAGATQHVDFSTLDRAPGFVFLGLTADGVRWCNHISVDSFSLQRLVIQAQDLWGGQDSTSPTDVILERLRPLCSEDTMVQLRLEGELTRSAYHQLDLNQIRRYGEEHCFALAIDDSDLFLLPEQETVSTETGERFSPREELIALADEWIVASADEQEREALRITKEELLLAMDEIKSKR
ncbi:MAG TPA: metallophosphoesterase [Ktedonobacteraceae bacterium]